MIPTDSFWDGTGGALIGTVGAAVIALVVVLLTRRNDRALLRDQVGLDAATRVFDASLSIANLLEAPLKNVHSYEEWLPLLLERVERFRYIALMDGMLIGNRALRDRIMLDADWLSRELIDELGFTEGAALQSGGDVDAALDTVKAAAHSRFAELVRQLNGWRATFRPKERPWSKSVAEALKAKPEPYWRTIGRDEPS